MAFRRVLAICAVLLFGGWLIGIGQFVYRIASTAATANAAPAAAVDANANRNAATETPSLSRQPPAAAIDRTRTPLARLVARSQPAVPLPPAIRMHPSPPQPPPTPPVLAAKPPTPAVSASARASAKRRYVAFGSTADAQYLFYAPIAALLWARLGWVPLFLFISSSRESQTGGMQWAAELAFTRHYVEKIAGGRVIVISPDDYDAADYRSAGNPPAPTPDADAAARAAYVTHRNAMAGNIWLIAQLSRIFAACDPQLPLDSILMTSDVDMLVLKNDLWDPLPGSPEYRIPNSLEDQSFHLVPAHYFGFKGPKVNAQNPWTGNDELGFQMCFIYARVWAWREALQFSTPAPNPAATSTTTVTTTTAAPASSRDDEFNRGCNAGTKIIELLAHPTTKIEWGFDQIYITRQLKRWRARNPTGILDTASVSGRSADSPTGDVRSTRMDLHFRDYTREKEMDGRFRKWEYPPEADLTQYTTAHAPRPDGFDEAKWAITRRAIATTLPADIMTRVVDVYYEQFTGKRPRTSFPPDMPKVLPP